MFYKTQICSRRRVQEKFDPICNIYHSPNQVHFLNFQGQESIEPVSATLMQLLMAVMTKMFSWRVNGRLSIPQLLDRESIHLRKKKLRTVVGMLNAGTMPAVMWMRSVMKQKTTPSTAETSIARSVTCSQNLGSGCPSNARSTDGASLGSPMLASMASAQ
jgi:hypothetical protein